MLFDHLKGHVAILSYQKMNISFDFPKEMVKAQLIFFKTRRVTELPKLRLNI